MKNHLIRFLAGVLALTCMIGLIACRDNPEQEEEKLDIVANGLTEYIVIRSDFSEKPVTNAAVRVRTAIIAATGVDIGIETDYVPRKSTVPTDTLEILVGVTNRAESAQALASLGDNEYVITMIGKRLVIIGKDDEGTVAAADAFVKQLLGYSEETETYSATALRVSPTLSIKGTYEKTKPVTPPIVVPGDVEKFDEQHKPTTSPLNYVVPTYARKNGLYVQNYESFDLTGARTTFQTNTLYADMYSVNSDSVMVYSSAYGNFASWYKPGTYIVDMMLAINRADKSYLSLDPSHYDDIQKNASGKYIEHSTGGSYYMVPSEEWIDFVWEEMLLPIITVDHPQSIAMEEPEMWSASGYSETFKREWLDFYGEEWENPSHSAEATLKANLLKTYLFERIITTLSARIKEVSPETQVYIATHSTINYSAWAIDAGLNHYVATGALDGVIGQTWADTHNSQFPYNGSSIRDNFTNAFVEFCSYVDSVEGLNFYALADPMADGSGYTEEDCQYMYRQTVAASLLQPEINRFQILPWVQRAYANVSGDYRTVQSHIFNMLNDIGGQKISLTAGTPGITYLLSDSLSWMNAGSGWALNTTSGMYGICGSLVRESVPVKMKAMDQITSADDLKGVTLLVVSFDSSVPLDEKVNIAIADWVKAGGTLLYVSGSNDYWDISDYFFWKNDKTPLDNLLRHLGLSNVKTAVAGSDIKSNSAFKSGKTDLNRVFGGEAVSSAYRKFTTTFSGTDNAILKLGNATVGIDEKVGKGHVVAVGIPSAYFSGTSYGSCMISALVEYALQYTDYEYVTGDMMSASRGNYVVAHAFADGQTLEGTYIDLYDSGLSILKNPTVPKDDSVILYNIAGFDRSVPRLGFTAGTLTDAGVSESAASMTYTVTSAGNTTISNRILLPDGVYPQSIKVMRGEKELPILKYVFDNENKTMFFSFDGSVNEITVTITWGKTKTDLGFSSMAYEEKNVIVNEKGLDAEYLYSNSAFTQATLRFCDNDGKLVYRFDLDEFESPTYYFHIAQNYIVEISSDNKNWTIIADYSQGGTVPRIQNGANATVLEVDPKDYDLDEEMFIRIRNTQTTGGFGATLSRIVIRHLVKLSGGETVSEKHQLLGNNNTSKIKTPTKTNVTDDSKYIISRDEAAGTAKYRRSIRTTSAGEDEEFIEFSDAGVNDSLRYCDNDRKIIYMFDVSEMLSATFSFSLFQNYILEVSTDGEDYTIIADYSQGGTVPHLTTGGNNVTIKVNPFDYGADETGALFVRLRNSDPSQGWGGSITNITLEYTKKLK